MLWRFKVHSGIRQLLANYFLRFCSPFSWIFWFLSLFHCKRLQDEWIHRFLFSIIDYVDKAKKGYFDFIGGWTRHCQIKIRWPRCHCLSQVPWRCFHPPEAWLSCHRLPETVRFSLNSHGWFLCQGDFFVCQEPLHSMVVMRATRTPGTSRESTRSSSGDNDWTQDLTNEAVSWANFSGFPRCRLYENILGRPSRDCKIVRGRAGCCAWRNATGEHFWAGYLFLFLIIPYLSCFLSFNFVFRLQYLYSFNTLFDRFWMTNKLSDGRATLAIAEKVWRCSFLYLYIHQLEKSDL